MVGNDSNLFTMHRCSELQTSDSSAPIFCDQPVGGQYIAVLNRLGPVVICEIFVYGMIYYHVKNKIVVHFINIIHVILREIDP